VAKIAQFRTVIFIDKEVQSADESWQNRAIGFAKDSSLYPTRDMPTTPQQPREVFSIPEHDTPKDSPEFISGDGTGRLFSNSDACPKIDGAAEKRLCSKLNQLSLEERTQAIHELHGVADIEAETAEMLTTKLREMTLFADSFGETERTVAYRKVLKMDKAYVNDKIKLLCLRADYYNSEKAATRMMSFFSFKQRLFGDDKLARDIVLDDFTSEDREVLDSGVVQLLQQRDRAGRGITLHIGNFSHRTRIEALVGST
jgi:hypothetical protein